MLVGALAGLALGSWLGARMTAQYTMFFRFPLLAFRIDPATPVLATAVSLLAGAAGAVGALRRVLRLAPASAMRPPAPPTYRHTLLERLGLASGLSRRGRMVLRSISSRPIRFVLATLGTAGALAIVILGLCWRDASGALFRDGDGWAAYVVEDGRARRRAVAVGARGERESVIDAGLAAGTQVVVYPSDAIADGVRVRPRPGA